MRLTLYQQDHFWCRRTTIGINFRSGGDRFWPRTKIFVTLINNFILGLKREKAAEAKRSARSVTKNVHYYEEEVHGITLCIINTPGLESKDLTREQEQEALTTLSELTNNKPDLLLYCISLVGRYDDKDDRIVVRLTDAFGGEIWSHAILVLTHGDELEDDEEENRELLNKFTEEFEKSLEKAGVNDVPVKFNPGYWPP